MQNFNKPGQNNMQELKLPQKFTILQLNLWINYSTEFFGVSKKLCKVVFSGFLDGKHIEKLFQRIIASDN